MQQQKPRNLQQIFQTDSSKDNCKHFCTHKVNRISDRVYELYQDEKKQTVGIKQILPILQAIAKKFKLPDIDMEKAEALMYKFDQDMDDGLSLQEFKMLIKTIFISKVYMVVSEETKLQKMSKDELKQFHEEQQHIIDVNTVEKIEQKVIKVEGTKEEFKKMQYTCNSQSKNAQDLKILQGQLNNEVGEILEKEHQRKLAKQRIVSFMREKKQQQELRIIRKKQREAVMEEKRKEEEILRQQMAIQQEKRQKSIKAQYDAYKKKLQIKINTAKRRTSQPYMEMKNKKYIAPPSKSGQYFYHESFSSDEENINIQHENSIVYMDKSLPPRPVQNHQNRVVFKPKQQNYQKFDENQRRLKQKQFQESFKKQALTIFEQKENQGNRFKISSNYLNPTFTSRLHNTQYNSRSFKDLNMGSSDPYNNNSYSSSKNYQTMNYSMENSQSARQKSQKPVQQKQFIIKNRTRSHKKPVNQSCPKIKVSQI